MVQGLWFKVLRFFIKNHNYQLSIGNYQFKNFVFFLPLASQTDHAHERANNKCRRPTASH